MSLELRLNGVRRESADRLLATSPFAYALNTPTVQESPFAYALNSSTVQESPFAYALNSSTVQESPFAYALNSSTVQASPFAYALNSSTVQASPFTNAQTTPTAHDVPELTSRMQNDNLFYAIGRRVRRVVAISLLVMSPFAYAQNTPMAQIVLTWNAPTSGATPTSYDIARGAVAGSHPTVVNTGSTNTTYTLQQMPMGTHFIVARTRADSAVSGDSNEASATINRNGRCDINGDRKVNAVDLNQLLLVIRGSISCPGYTCDVNKSGGVNSADATFLSSVIAGKPCPQ
jgi:hypothetical protein